MSNFTTQNKKLAVKPLEHKGPEAQKIGGISLMAQRINTTITDLLFDAEIDNSIIPNGTKIAFMGDASAQPWNKQVLRHGGVEFVLAPWDQVLMIAPAEEPNENK